MAAAVGAAESFWWIWILTHWRSPTGSSMDSGMPGPEEIFSMTVLAGISTLGSLMGFALIVSILGWLVGHGARTLSLRRCPPPPPLPAT